MARKATEIEERLASGEKVLTDEFIGGHLPHVKVKVIYLGGNPHKTMRLKGIISIVREERIGISSIVSKLFAPRKWVELTREEQEQVRNELEADQKNLLASDEIRKQEGEHFTMYDFSTIDSLGRPLPHKTELSREKYQMTEDGRRYQVVEHIGHIVALLRSVDRDGAKQFKIVGTPGEIEVVQDYIRQTKKVVNPDSGAAVLQEMGFDAT